MNVIDEGIRTMKIHNELVSRMTFGWIHRGRPHGRRRQLGPPWYAALLATFLAVPGCTRNTPDSAVSCESESFADTDGAPTGFELCSNGATYRKDAVTCHPRQLSDPDFWACMYPGDTSPCVQDSDCQDFASGGVCLAADADQGCTCHYDCQTDADCGPGALCRCAADPVTASGNLNRCIPAEGCQVDADCPAGERCLLAPLREEYCLDTMVAQCTSPADECSGDADCPPPMISGIARCEYDGQAGRFVCVDQLNCGP